MILKINRKQFLDTMLNIYCARIGDEQGILELSDLRKHSKATFDLEPIEEGWHLKANSLDAAFQGASLLKHGACRMICGVHTSQYSTRALQIDTNVLTTEDAFLIRDLGYNSLITNQLDEESLKIAKSVALKIYDIHHASLEGIGDYQTLNEHLLAALKAHELESDALVFNLPKELFFLADLADTVIYLSQRASTNTYISFPASASELYSVLEKSPYALTKNLLPLHDDFPTELQFWNRKDLLGVEGSIVNCKELPSIDNKDALAFGHYQCLGHWKESASPASI